MKVTKSSGDPRALLIVNIFLSYFSSGLAGFFYFFIVCLLAFLLLGILMVFGVDWFNALLQPLNISDFSFHFSTKNPADASTLFFISGVIFPLIGLIGKKVFRRIFRRELTFMEELKSVALLTGIGIIGVLALFLVAGFIRPGNGLDPKLFAGFLFIVFLIWGILALVCFALARSIDTFKKFLVKVNQAKAGSEL